MNSLKKCQNRQLEGPGQAFKCGRDEGEPHNLPCLLSTKHTFLLSLFSDGHFCHPPHPHYPIKSGVLRIQQMVKQEGDLSLCPSVVFYGLVTTDQLVLALYFFTKSHYNLQNMRLLCKGTKMPTRQKCMSLNTLLSTINYYSPCACRIHAKHCIVGLKRQFGFYYVNPNVSISLVLS